VTFDRVDPTTFDILVKTKQGSIYLEYLSSGYKSCLCLIIGLIKEIEYRNLSPSIEVGNFNGVVVIDELDLYLHPEWLAKLIPVLKKVFPLAQFIAATHSPHMLQAAEPEEVIALQFDSEGNVALHEIPSTSG